MKNLLAIALIAVSASAFAQWPAQQQYNPYGSASQQRYQQQLDNQNALNQQAYQQHQYQQQQQQQQQAYERNQYNQQQMENSANQYLKPKW